MDLKERTVESGGKKSRNLNQSVMGPYRLSQKQVNRLTKFLGWFQDIKLSLSLEYIKMAKMLCLHRTMRMRNNLLDGYINVSTSW